MEVESPSLHYVHPTYFEAGKVVEFIACGSNLDQPKLRFLVSFAGKYLVCDAFRVITHQKVRCDGGNSVASSNNRGHEMFRINVKHTNPDVFGPAFIEVENESGISNFIPILIGNKQICSELENLQGALSHHPNVQEDNNASSAIFSDTGFSKVDTARQIDMSDLLMDIAWLLKEPCKECNISFFSSLNVRRVTYILQFSLRNELICVLKAILKYVNIMIHRVNFQNLENLTVSADLLQLLEYMDTATEFLNQRTEHKETAKQDSARLSFMEALPVDLMINDMIIMTLTNPVVDRRNAGASASTLLSVDSDEIASLLPKDITRHKISFLRSGASHWPSKYWPTTMFSSPITRKWRATLAVCTSIMCFLICIIFFDTHKASDSVFYMGRYAHEVQTG
ncbi:Squamosa promoter-binding-like protein 9 [Platanthera zijinensis]|uniref:Squamosa promoter-binding-like protein 9 n=1 Tax=Platanthera zijinensis TaxID=2320716 RepID=A0AAP0BVM0_9ASPA